MAIGIASSLLVRVGADISQFESGMARVKQRVSDVEGAGRKTSTALAGVGSTLTKGVTLPIVAGLGFAVKAAADFESSLNTMKAVSGASAAQMAKVSATAKALGADVSLPGTSAKDAAEAMTELAKSGLSVNETMTAARGVLQLSAAAQIGNAEAAEIVGDALNAFSLEGRESTRVADLLAASANASSADIGDMALALQQSSAVAAQAGIPIEDTVAALSRLANAGIKGSDAGTSLKTTIQRLIAPTDVAAGALDDLGINVRDASGELKPISGLAQEFTTKTKGLSKAQRDAAFSTIFGADAIRAANILLTKGAAAQVEMERKVTQQGAAAELAAAKTKGFNGAMEGFRSAVETAAISVGTVLLPIATQMITKIAELVSRFETLSPGAQRAAVQFALFAAAVGPALLVLGKLGTAVSVLGPGLGRIAAPIGIAGLALGVAASQSDGFRQALVDMGAALAPVGSAIAAFTANPLAAAMIAGAAAAYALVTAFIALRGALTQLTVAAATNPFTVFLVAAGAVIGALALAASASGRTSDSMRDMRQAADDAARATDRLRDATVQLEGADLGAQRAKLTLKQALADQARVQQQVRDGTLKGADAELALEDAALRVKEARAGVRQAENQVTTARKTAITSARDLVRANNDEVGAAKEHLAAVTRQNAALLAQGKRVPEVEAAQKNLAKTYSDNNKQIDKLLPQLDQVGKGSGRGAREARVLASALRSIKADNAAQRTKALNDAVKGTRGASQNATGAVRGAGSAMATAGGQANTAAGKARDLGRALDDLPKNVTVKVNIQTNRTVTTVRNEVEREASPSRAAKEVTRGAKEYNRQTTQSVASAMAAGAKKGGYQITQAVIDAVASAKANVRTISADIAQTLGNAIDASTERRVRALADSFDAINVRRLTTEITTLGTALDDLTNSAESKQISAIDSQLEAAQTERQRIALNEALAEAKAKGEGVERAQADINEFNLAQERKRLQETLDNRRSEIQATIAAKEAEKAASEEALRVAEDNIRSEAETRKAGLERGLADLADAFARGQLTERQYADQRRALIEAEAPEYRSIGELLGQSFASGYADALEGLKDQIREIVEGPQSNVTGAGPDKTSPFAVAFNEWKERYDELVKARGQAVRDGADALARAQAAAREDGSPGGKKVTDAEANQIQAVKATWQKRVDSANSALKAWQAQRPKRAAMGAVLRGSVTDSLPLMARGGEAVIDRAGTEGLMRFLTNPPSGSGGSVIELNITVAPGTGISTQQAADLARQLRPELARLTSGRL